jgi:hypothetical protein
MFSEQLSSVYAEFQTLQERTHAIKLGITVYVTCDESFTEEHKSLLSTITAPKNSAAVKKNATEHGIAALRYRSTEEKDSVSDIKGKVKEITTTSSQSSNEEGDACGPDETCCCRTTIDESSVLNTTPCCCCTPANGTRISISKQAASNLSISSSSSTQQNRKQTLLVHPSIQIFSGRPQTKDIIRRSLEQALGESAVVVCGPQGLVSDVKQNVVELSDERAIHKGTGAQGVYLHTESFGY